MTTLNLDNGRVRAFGIRAYGGVDKLEELTIPLQPLQGREIRVKIEAVGLNPVDTIVRNGYFSNGKELEQTLILGYDGAGEVVEVGPDAALFKVGDKVYYAGDVTKPGTNSDYAVVDERIVGHKPASLSYAQAAALPLVALTAWEGLFEELGIKAFDRENDGKRLLVIPGAGGVGSIVIQLAAKLLGLEVIATASRPESKQYCLEHGAHHVISHAEPLQPQLAALGIDGVDYIYNGHEASVYLDQFAGIIKPYGKIVNIVSTPNNVNLSQFMMKRVSISWEIMFARAIFGIDVESQHRILNHVGRLVDAGLLKATVTKELPYTLENLREAHKLLESRTMVGKAVLYR
eukprot:gene10221-11313_t